MWSDLLLLVDSTYISQLAVQLLKVAVATGDGPLAIGVCRPDFVDHNLFLGISSSDRVGCHHLGPQPALRQGPLV